MGEEINDNQNMLENDSSQTQPTNDNQSMPENDSINPYQTIIDQQQQQISALIEQTTALNNQIISMVNSGAQFNDGNSNNIHSQAKTVEKLSQQVKSLSDDIDYSLESLAKEIGKRNL